MRQSLLADLKPVGSLETLLVERAALCLWRLRRVMRFEAGFMGNGMNVNSHHDPYGELLTRFNTADKLVLLTRYETAIERSLYLTLAELRAMQQGRGKADDGTIDVTPKGEFVS